MKPENELRDVVAKNLISYRKLHRLTQLQLAEKLNYSDKSISKWERAEGLPDLYIIASLAELYGVKIDDLLSEHVTLPVPEPRRNRPLYALIAFTSVWAVATGVFVLLAVFAPTLERIWLAFIYAIPVSLAVLIGFSKLWGNRFHLFLSISALLWTIALAIFLSIANPRVWLFFIAVIPLQLIALFWGVIKPKEPLGTKS
jgi:transcriptional regulator with XRE-family HTH domain